VKNVETSRPPITAMASGWFASVPTPKASAMGRRPTTVVSVVMRIGRSRIRPARGTATCSGSPWRRRSLMYSTSRTPFDTTMPTIMMMPMNDVVESVVLVRYSAQKTPMSPMGTENMIVKGSLSERNWDASTM
jgi:hypothetical protein